MDILIRSAVIVNKESNFHLKTKDLLIENGNIVKIGDRIVKPGHIKEISYPNLHVSAGWFDLKANFCDPGHEEREDIVSGIHAAAAGGFTGVLLMPSTDPPLQNKASIEYVKGKSAGFAVDIYSSGLLTVNRNGKELCELFDMKRAGAVAFTDDKCSVQDSGVMLRALLYGKQVDSLVIAFAEDVGLTGKSQVNESMHTTRLGLKGIPALAEEMVIARDLALCEYTGSKLHFSLVSTAGSVDLIRKAKQKGLPVTADISAYHLMLDDSMLDGFDTNLKTKPPLRSIKDQKALCAGIQDDTIDSIVSDHCPQDNEHKRVEFDFASYGMIGLETCFPVAFTALNKIITLEKLIEKFTAGRKLLGLLPVIFNEDQPANLTLFVPDAEWEFTESDIVSRSKNTPFVGKKLGARVLGIINNNQMELNVEFK